MDLGLERAGFTIAYHAEVDPYCCKVLAKHWPNVPNLGDVTKINWSTLTNVDVIAGGYPCQPFSVAGKRQGENDPRHLWPWVREAISALRPRYAILENVPGHRTMGGLTVIGELTEIGYDAEWRIISAAGLGANHLRKRLIIVAYPQVIGSDGRKLAERMGTTESRETVQIQIRRSDCDVADPACRDGRNTLANTNSQQLGVNGAQTNTATQRGIWDDHRIRETCHGLGKWWETEPNVGRVADGIPNRVDRLRGLGNAVVPQVAEYIGRLIMANK